MSKRKLLYLPRAIRDLDEIWNYSSKTWNNDKADRYFLALTQLCDQVSECSDLARKRDDVRPHYRPILSGSHIIFFNEIADSLIVIRILHQRMDFERLIYFNSTN